jgi:hypothetical protein
MQGVSLKFIVFYNKYLQISNQYSIVHQMSCKKSNQLRFDLTQNFMSC